MNTKKLLPSRRRLTFLLIILVLIAVFFTGYNFYYIPANQNIVHKNAFLILNNISRNVAERNDYLQAAFGNILKTSLTPEFQQQQLNVYKLDGKILYHTKINAPGADLNTPNDSGIYLTHISNDSLFYASANIKNSGTSIYVPAQKFIEPSITSQKKELFESYILLHNTAGLIYADNDLGINRGFVSDSLVADKKDALFSGVKDFEIKGIKYKMFFYPFRLGREDVQLCGFLNYETYYKKIHQVPVVFIYPIIIILVLILIMMPIVKFYLMGKDEQVTFADFILAVVSFFSGAAIITIIIIQVLLLLAADLRIKQNLQGISRQTENNFTKEIKEIYLQLDKLNTVIKTDPLTEEMYRVQHSDKYNVSGIIKNYFKQHHSDSNLYYNFNRVTWVDEDGNQQLKGQTDPGDPVFTNVGTRDYFKIFNTGPGYPVPGMPNARFGFEPVNSLTNGDFSVVISEKNNIGRGWTTTIAAPMYSVLKTILPPGYGFCITGEDGRVLLHSETNRSLQENIIDDAEPSRQIAEAIKSRQESFFPSLNLYGKSNALNIKPINGLPLHLFTFYDKGYIVPVNMRILLFSLVFCSITFVICIVMWFGFRSRRKKFYVNISGPMYKLKWMMPKKAILNFMYWVYFFYWQTWCSS